MLALALGLLQGCARLPGLEGRSVSTAATDTDSTPLGQAVQPSAQAHPGRSGMFALADARNAFAARALLARAATRTLDVQYYIWRDDLSGTLLLRELLDAAGRGVRVRLLLDDNNTAGLDALLAALDSHPRIEVRLFNPFAQRRWRLLGYLTDFTRLNRRMHNKSFTADNQVTIVGGRNVGDEYFGAGGDLLFADLDVMAAGPVARAVSRDFDRYWASASAYPVDRLLTAVDPAAQAALRARAERLEHEPAARAYIEALSGSPFVRELLQGRLPLEWVPMRLVSDDPAKALGQAADSALLPQRLRELLDTPRRELLVVSPYFVPTAAGVAAFRELAQEGVRICVLTNALEATDVAAVHAGYALYRRPLLEAGIALYEMKHEGLTPSPGQRGPVGSSATSLHAKTFAVDGARVFIGSFNFDPRSARLNTEMGFVIHSPALARQMARAFDERVPRRAYQVRLGPDSGLRWVEHTTAGERIHEQEPGAGFWLLLGVRVLSWLPIEGLL